MIAFDVEKWELAELLPSILVGLHLVLRIGGLEIMEDIAISPEAAGGAACVAIIIRGPENDQKKKGVIRSVAATNFDIWPAQTMARWLSSRGWNPNSGESISSRNKSVGGNRISNETATEGGIGASWISTHSSRAGCATTLYAAGAGPIDRQRRIRWKSSIYMRYIWRDNLRLRLLSSALTSPTRLSEHLQLDLVLGGKVNFGERYRNGGASRTSSPGPPLSGDEYDFFSRRYRISYRISSSRRKNSTAPTWPRYSHGYPARHTNQKGERAGGYD